MFQFSHHRIKFHAITTNNINDCIHLSPIYVYVYDWKTFFSFLLFTFQPSSSSMTEMNLSNGQTAVYFIPTPQALFHFVLCAYCSFVYGAFVVHVCLHIFTHLFSSLFPLYTSTEEKFMFAHPCFGGGMSGCLLCRPQHDL